MLHSIKSPKEIPKIVDCEWVGSDRPAVVTSHSCLRIMSLDMHTSMSAIENWQLAGTLLLFKINCFSITAHCGIICGYFSNQLNCS